MESFSGDEPVQLRLFEGGIYMGALRMKAKELKERASGSARTLEAYAFVWRAFCRWCNDAGRDPLPCSQDTLEVYLLWLVSRERKVATAEHHTAGITFYHRRAGYPSPRSAGVSKILSELKKDLQEEPEKKEAISALDLKRVAEGCDLSTTAGLRDRTLVLLGFASTFRRSELARLQLADVDENEIGVVLFKKRSKTDQKGKGRYFGVWNGKQESTDPVIALKAWIVARGSWQGPLFCRISRTGRVIQRPITGESVNDAIQRAIARVGLDASRYGAHSLRAGGVTAAAKNGCTDQEIKEMSGHRSTMVMEGYIRGNRVFDGRNPLEGVL